MIVLGQHGKESPVSKFEVREIDHNGWKFEVYCTACGEGRYVNTREQGNLWARWHDRCMGELPTTYGDSI